VKRLVANESAVGLRSCRGPKVLHGVLTTVVAAAACFVSAARAADRVYWANESNSTISFANLDRSGGGGQLPLTGAMPNGPRGVAIDSAAGKIYWANNNTTTISFALLDGSGGGNQLAIAGATASSPAGVAIDPVRGKIYWANQTNSTISFANLDGSGGGGQLPLTGATPNGPVGVAIDPAAGKIYWANRGNNTISFARLDGSGGGQLLIAGTTPVAPEGVAIDPAAGLIYWANSVSNTISFARLDGTGGGELPLTGATPSHPTLPALLKAPSGAGMPAITGGSAMGSVLSCSQGAWAPDLLGAFLYRAPQSIAFQWSAGGTDIAGATANSYTAFAAGDYRCRVTASNAAGNAAQTSAAHTVGATPAGTSPATMTAGATKAMISALGESNATFTVGPASTPLNGQTAARRHKRGTVFSFRLDQPATVKIAIQTKARGRRVGRTCRADTPRLRRDPRCVRTIIIATLARTARVGLNTVAFSGRIRGTALKPGRYQAAFTAVDSAGAAPPKTLNFAVAKQ
jgi:hypothetical protein